MRTRFEYTSAEERERIVDGAMELLEVVGMRFGAGDALEALGEAGAAVDRRGGRGADPARAGRARDRAVPARDRARRRHARGRLRAHRGRAALPQLGHADDDPRLPHRRAPRGRRRRSPRGDDRPRRDAFGEHRLGARLRRTIWRRSGARSRSSPSCCGTRASTSSTTSTIARRSTTSCAWPRRPAATCANARASASSAAPPRRSRRTASCSTLSTDLAALRRPGPRPADADRRRHGAAHRRGDRDHERGRVLRRGDGDTAARPRRAADHGRRARPARHEADHLQLRRPRGGARLGGLRRGRPLPWPRLHGAEPVDRRQTPRHPGRLREDAQGVHRGGDPPRPHDGHRHAPRRQPALAAADRHRRRDGAGDAAHPRRSRGLGGDPAGRDDGAHGLRGGTTCWRRTRAAACAPARSSRRPSPTASRTSTGRRRARTSSRSRPTACSRSSPPPSDREPLLDAAQLAELEACVAAGAAAVQA